MRQHPPSVLPRWLVLGLLAVSLLPTGCSSSKRKAWQARHKSADELLTMALESKRPDERRLGVVGLSQRDDAGEEWAIKVFDTVARTDTDANVRCAAVRGLAESAGPERVPTLLALLGAAGEGSPDVRPAPGQVRWEAAKLLLTILRDRGYDATEDRAVAKTLLDRLVRDDDRNVRLTVIDALAYVAVRPVPSALVDVMQTEGRDFAVRHAAEQSLIALTGRTHNHDPIAWRQWLAETSNPFEHRGETPEGLEPPPEKHWWEL